MRLQKDTFQITGTAFKQIRQRTITNEGNALWNGGHIYLYEGAVWHNKETGVFSIELTDNRNFDWQSGQPRPVFNNEGKIIKTQEAFS